MVSDFDRTSQNFVISPQASPRQGGKFVAHGKSNPSFLRDIISFLAGA
jgi:hypothetical protein